MTDCKVGSSAFFRNIPCNLRRSASCNVVGEDRACQSLIFPAQFFSRFCVWFPPCNRLRLPPSCPEDVGGVVPSQMCRLEPATVPLSGTIQPNQHLRLNSRFAQMS